MSGDGASVYIILNRVTSARDVVKRRERVKVVLGGFRYPGNLGGKEQAISMLTFFGMWLMASRGGKDMRYKNFPGSTVGIARSPFYLSI